MFLLDFLPSFCFLDIYIQRYIVQSIINYSSSHMDLLTFERLLKTERIRLQQNKLVKNLLKICVMYGSGSVEVQEAIDQYVVPAFKTKLNRIVSEYFPTINRQSQIEKQLNAIITQCVEIMFMRPIDAISLIKSVQKMDKQEIQRIKKTSGFIDLFSKTYQKLVQKISNTLAKVQNNHRIESLIRKTVEQLKDKYFLGQHRQIRSLQQFQEAIKKHRIYINSRYLSDLYYTIKLLGQQHELTHEMISKSTYSSFHKQLSQLIQKIPIDYQLVMQNLIPRLSDQCYMKPEKITRLIKYCLQDRGRQLIIRQCGISQGQVSKIKGDISCLLQNIPDCLQKAKIIQTIVQYVKKQYFKDYSLKLKETFQKLKQKILFIKEKLVELYVDYVSIKDLLQSYLTESDSRLRKINKEYLIEKQDISFFRKMVQCKQEVYNFFSDLPKESPYVQAYSNLILILDPQKYLQESDWLQLDDIQPRIHNKRNRNLAKQRIEYDDSWFLESNYKKSYCDQVQEKSTNKRVSRNDKQDYARIIKISQDSVKEFQNNKQEFMNHLDISMIQKQNSSNNSMEEVYLLKQNLSYIEQQEYLQAQSQLLRNKHGLSKIQTKSNSQIQQQKLNKKCKVFGLIISNQQFTHKFKLKKQPKRNRDKKKYYCQQCSKSQILTFNHHYIAFIQFQQYSTAQYTIHFQGSKPGRQQWSQKITAISSDKQLGLAILTTKMAKKNRSKQINFAILNSIQSLVKFTRDSSGKNSQSAELKEEKIFAYLQLLRTHFITDLPQFEQEQIFSQQNRTFASQYFLYFLKAAYEERAQQLYFKYKLQNLVEFQEPISQIVQGKENFQQFQRFYYKMQYYHNLIKKKDLKTQISKLQNLFKKNLEVQPRTKMSEILLKTIQLDGPYKHLALFDQNVVQILMKNEAISAYQYFKVRGSYLPHLLFNFWDCEKETIIQSFLDHLIDKCKINQGQNEYIEVNGEDVINIFVHQSKLIIKPQAYFTTIKKLKVLSTYSKNTLNFKQYLQQYFKDCYRNLVNRNIHQAITTLLFEPCSQPDQQQLSGIFKNYKMRIKDMIKIFQIMSQNIKTYSIRVFCDIIRNNFAISRDNIEKVELLSYLQRRATKKVEKQYEQIFLAILETLNFQVKYQKKKMQPPLRQYFQAMFAMKLQSLQKHFLINLLAKISSIPRSNETSFVNVLQSIYPDKNCPKNRYLIKCYISKYLPNIKQIFQKQTSNCLKNNIKAFLHTKVYENQCSFIQNSDIQQIIKDQEIPGQVCQQDQAHNQDMIDNFEELYGMIEREVDKLQNFKKKMQKLQKCLYPSNSS